VDDKDIIGRATVNFAELAGNKEAVLHVGGAFSVGDSPVGTGFGTFRTEARGATYFTAPVLASANTLDKTLDRKRYGLEFAAATGPFKVQTQYVKVDHSFQTTNAAIDADVKTFYVEGLWALTGEKHSDRYKAGAFGGIKPNKDFDASTFTGGAWELGARYSSLDAADFNQSALTTTAGNVTAATGFTRVKGYTLGVKFLPNMNSRFMLEYVGTDFENPIGAAVAAGGIAVNGRNETQEKAILFRSQFMF
jgi:phosphate-selective porin OprO/OprP